MDARRLLVACCAGMVVEPASSERRQPDNASEPRINQAYTVCLGPSPRARLGNGRIIINGAFDSITPSPRVRAGRGSGEEGHLTLHILSPSSPWPSPPAAVGEGIIRVGTIWR